MNNAIAIRIASGMGMLAVALGAFGAHGLKTLLDQNHTTATWETAVFYHFIHAVMLFVLALRRPVATGPWILFLAGILIFSGTLYVLAVTNIKWLGAVTPVGGICLIAAWLWLLLKPRLVEP